MTRLPQLRTQLSPDELPLIYGLGTAARERYFWWQELVEGILKSPRRGEAITAAVKQFGHMKGISVQTLYRKCRAVELKGPTALIDDRLVRKMAGVKQPSNLPLEFIDFWFVLVMKNQRKTAPAYRKLFYDHLLADKEIPGYGTWRDIYRAEFPGLPMPDKCPYEPYRFTPRGWSEKNLNNHKPHAHALAMARVGRGYAKNMLPPVPTSRVGLYTGQYLLFDDMVVDCKVNLPGVNKEEMRPIQLGMYELFSGFYKHGVLCRTLDYETGTKRSIRDSDFRLFLAAQLRSQGYRPEGTTLILEHATANINGDTEAMLDKHTNGKLRTERSGKLNTPLIKGLYDARPRGNPKYKAAIESIHNIIHNETAALIGQIGKDWEHCPEQYYGESKENRLLVNALAAVMQENPARAALFRLPFLPFSEFQQFNNAYLDRINRRRHHRLQGYHEAGLVCCFFRFYKGAPWLPLEAQYLTANPQQKAAIEAACSDPENQRVLNMTPEEVYTRDLDKFVKYPAWGMADLLGKDCQIRTTVTRQHTFEFRRKEFGQDKLQYYSLVTASDGSETMLHYSCKEYACFLNPLMPEELFVFELGGAFLGTAARIQAHCRADYDGVRKNLGELKHIEATLAKQWYPMGIQQLQDRADAATANIAAMSGIIPEPSTLRAEDFDLGPHTEFSAVDFLNRKGGTPALNEE